MDEADRRLLDAVQEGFPLVERPFAALGELLGLDEDDVMARLERLHQDGIIRRIGPILDVRKLGLSGVLVAVKVPVEEALRAAAVINDYEEVSHNYLRPSSSGYNIWFTLSSRPERIGEILDEIAGKTGLKLMLLPTKRTFKIGVKFDIL
jgi:DNA-binding Lrp family transcriptional regulator